MKNLAIETFDALLHNDKVTGDVKWAGTRTSVMTWQTFQDLADFEYDDNSDCTCINRELVVVGNNWWLERAGCAGCEFWAFKTLPQMPTLVDHTMLTSSWVTDSSAKILKEK